MLDLGLLPQFPLGLGVLPALLRVDTFVVGHFTQNLIEHQLLLRLKLNSLLLGQSFLLSFLRHPLLLQPLPFLFICIQFFLIMTIFKIKGHLLRIPLLTLRWLGLQPLQPLRLYLSLQQRVNARDL